LAALSIAVRNYGLAGWVDGEAGMARQAEWRSQAGSLWELAGPSAVSVRLYGIAIVSDDEEAAEASYHDARSRVNQLRSRYLSFHSRFNPGNVKSKDLSSFLAFDAGFRRILGGITAQLSACEVMRGSSEDDSEEKDFLAAVVLVGSRIVDENVDFVQSIDNPRTGNVVAVAAMSQRLEADHEELLAMLVRVEEMAQARKSGEATLQDFGDRPGTQDGALDGGQAAASVEESDSGVAPPAEMMPPMAEKTCDTKGCSNRATVEVVSTIQGTGLGFALPGLGYACEEHASKFPVGKRFREYPDGSVRFGFSLRSGGLVHVVSRVTPLTED
jgi:hypothetical protein